MKIASSCVENFATDVLIPQVLKEINDLEGIEALGRFLKYKDRETLYAVNNHIDVVANAQEASNITFRINVDDSLGHEEFFNIINICAKKTWAYHFDNDGRGFFYDAKQYGTYTVSTIKEIEDYEPFFKGKLDCVTIRLLSKVIDYHVSCSPNREIDLTLKLLMQSPVIHNLECAA